MDEKLTLSVDEVAVLLGIGRGLAYEKARSGEIPTLRIGRRLLVPKVALNRMLEECGAGKGPNEAKEHGENLSGA